MSVRRVVLTQLRAAIAAAENSDAYEDALCELAQLATIRGWQPEAWLFRACRRWEAANDQLVSENVLEIVAVTLGFEPHDMKKGGDA